MKDRDGNELVLVPRRHVAEIGGAVTDHRQLLELAAKAAGIKYDAEKSKPNAVSGAFFGLWLEIDGEPNEYTRRSWNPLVNDGDCARMCAALLIGTTWWNHKVECWCIDELKNIDIGLTPEQFTEHNNDRSAAWRMAALRVAAEIGKGMRG